MKTDTLTTKDQTKFPVEELRGDFPILQQIVNGKKLTYLDSAATSQKPISVIRAVESYYSEKNSNVHRGIHHLSDVATRAYEGARQKIAQFINAESQDEIIFTNGTTHGINLLAHSLSEGFLKPGDEILISQMEHHSNIVPWQMAAQRTGAIIKYIPITSNGEWDYEAIPSLLTDNTAIISVCHTSNSLGTINETSTLLEFAKDKGIPFILDGAQWAPHSKIDVRKADCDFLVFSGHKMCGPTGIGVLYGKTKWLEKLPPFFGGGDMIKTVKMDSFTYNDLPYKLEAGTPNIAGAVGLGEAIDYLASISMEAIQEYEASLTAYASKQMRDIPGLKIFADLPNKAAVISFEIEGVHSSDLGSILNMQGIAVRTGHHCTQPIMDFFQISGTTRASFSFINTFKEVDSLVEGILKAKKMLR